MRTTLLTCLILTVVVAASAAHASSPGGIDGYHLVAYPPSGSAHSPSLSLMVDVLAGFWSTTSLYLTETNLSGWVQDAGNRARIGDTPVVVHDDTWSVELWTIYTLEVFGEDGEWAEAVVLVPSPGGLATQKL